MKKITPPEMNRRKYNACYRLRKKGFKISTKSKTIFAPEKHAEQKTVKILMSEYHFAYQIIFNF